MKRAYVDVQGAAEYLALSERTIRRLLAAHAIPHRLLKVPGSRRALVRFDLHELDVWTAADSGGECAHGPGECWARSIDRAARLVRARRGLRV